MRNFIMDTSFDLSGRKALVTGSSRGIGRAIALGLARQGADVGVHYVGHSREAEGVVREIRSMGRASFCVRADLGTEDCAEVIWYAVERDFGHLDILVLNASIQIRKPWDEITVTDFEAQMGVNVRASLLLMQKVVPGMKAHRWGRILTVGSTQEFKPHPEMLIYASSKAAQTLMARSLALQLAPRGITVNNLAPGTIHTDRNSEVLADESYRREVVAGIPAQYIGEAEDCVGAALLLCSEAGRYITGDNLVVDGGKAFS